MSAIVEGMTKNSRKLYPINPATGQALDEVEVASDARISQVVEMARSSQKAWAAKDFAERAQGLQRFCKLLENSAVVEKLAQSITQEMGKPIRESRGEAQNLAKRISDFIPRAQQACQRETSYERNLKVVVDWCPLGVVAVIAPWNYPVSTPNNLIISALLTGNAVVFKPSEYTPHTGALYQQLLQECLPIEGLVGLVQGGAIVGQTLVSADVDMIAFTGSIVTGQAIMKEAAVRMKRLVLELGGKDPMIVLPGADIQAAATHAAREATRNSGQMCVSVERVIVHRQIADEFIRHVLEVVPTLRVGDPREESTDIGPLVSEQQRQKVLSQLAQARAQGATMLVEGRAFGPGFFLEPSVVGDVTSDMDLAQNETFGPVVAIQTVDTEDAAIHLANQTHYGLGASIWGAPGPALEHLASCIEAGMIGINRGLSAAGGAPWVGWKMSGFGYTRSVEGMRHFMQPRSQTSVVES